MLQFNLLTIGAQVFGLLVFLFFLYSLSIQTAIPSFIEIQKFRIKKLVKNQETIIDKNDNLSGLEHHDYQIVTHCPHREFSSSSKGDDFNFKKFIEKFNVNNGYHLKELMFSKSYFVLAMWNVENRHHVFDDYESLMKVINNSKELQKWYTTCVKRYAYLHELPDWVLLDDSLRDKWITDSSDVFETHNKRRKDIIKRREDVWNSIEQQLTDIDNDEIELKIGFYCKYPIVAISKISEESLPAERLMMHIGKSGKVLEKALEAELDKYKQDLCKEYVLGDGDIMELVEILKEAL